LRPPGQQGAEDFVKELRCHEFGTRGYPELHVQKKPYWIGDIAACSVVNPTKEQQRSVCLSPSADASCSVSC